MPKTLPIHFAPLQGYTEVFYRNAHAACFGGIDTYYTPFLTTINDFQPLRTDQSKIMSSVSSGFKNIIFDPEEVQALLSLITEYPQISFSIKMRLGWEDPEECLKLAPIINELPLRQVVMHPRLGKQQYKGEVDLKAFEAFQNACKHPLIYNGDINSVEDIHRIQEQFPGLAGMMIGRGLLANPALALEYRQNRALEFDEMREKLQSMHKCVYNQYAEQLEGGDEQLLNKMKTFWEYLMPQADRKLLKAIHKSTSLNKYNQAILAFFNQR